MRLEIEFSFVAVGIMRRFDVILGNSNDILWVYLPFYDESISKDQQFWVQN